MNNKYWDLIQTLFHQSVDLDKNELSEFIQQLNRQPDTVKQQVLKLIQQDRAFAGNQIQNDIDQLGQEIQFPQIEGYHIEQLIAVGGMGSVFLAQDTSLSRQVAIKVLHPHLSQQDKYNTRFIREAQAAARIQHETINTIYEVAKTGAGAPYIASHYCDGKTLAQHIQQGDLSFSQSYKIIMQLAEGLTVAHRLGVIHRDLKPDNIIILASGTPKLVDFGIAKMRDEYQTSTGEIIGTPSYMSPEQFRGEAIDESTDIWALGIIIYEILRGQTPYQGQTTSEIIYSLLHEPVAYPKDIFSPYEPLVELIQHCLKVDKSQRPISMEWISRQLMKIQTQLKSSDIYDLAIEYQTSQTTAHIKQAPISVTKKVIGLSLWFDNAIFEVNKEQLLSLIETTAKKYSSLIIEHNKHYLLLFGYPSSDEFMLKNSVLCAENIIHQAQQLKIGISCGIHSNTVNDSLTAPLNTQQWMDSLYCLTPDSDNSTVYSTFVSSALIALLPNGSDIDKSHKINSNKGVLRRLNNHQWKSQTHRLTLESECLTPFTGRESQQSVVLENWQLALEEDSQRILISGEAGIGKSRLIYECKQQIMQHHSPCLIELNCLPYDQSSSYAPILKWLSHELKSHKTELSRNRINDYLKNFTHKQAFDHLLLSQLLGLTVTPKEAALLPEGDLLNRHYQSLLLRLMTWRKNDTHCLIIIEDLHWIDSASSLVIEQLLQASSTQKTLIILSCRPEYKPTWLAHVITSNLYLSKLRYTQSASLIKDLLNVNSAKNTLSQQAINQLIERANGNPLFLEELVKSALLEQTGDSSRQIPASLQAALVSRIEKLGPAQSLVQTASVIGRYFSLPLLKLSSQLDHTDFKQQFDVLIKSGMVFISEEENQCHFKHALIRDAAYQTLTKSSSQRLHASIAQAIEQSDADCVQTQPAILAQHWEKSGNLIKAAQYWLQSALRNLSIYAISESIEQAEYAMSILATLNNKDADVARLKLSIYKVLGPAIMNRYGYADERAGDAYSQALTLSKTLNDEGADIDVLFGNWTYACVRANHQESLTLSQQLVTYSERNGIRSEICEAYLTQGIGDFYRGDLLQARQTLQSSIDHYDAEDSLMHITMYGQDPFVAASNFQSWNELLLGNFEQAKQFAESSIAHARTTKHPMTIAYALSFATFVSMSLGEFDKAQRIVEESIALCSKHEVILFLGLSLILRSLLHFNNNELEQGESLMQRAMEVYFPLGAQVMVPNFFAVKAEVLIKAQRFEEASELIEQALGLIEQTSERWCLAYVLSIKAFLLQSTEKMDEAAATIQLIAEVIDEQKAEGFKLMLLQKGFVLPELN